jgi:NAD(P)-binding Rossmann-like domain
MQMVSLICFNRTVFFLLTSPTIGWWRDVLAFSWDFHTYYSRPAIKDMIERADLDSIGLAKFRLDPMKEVTLQKLSPEFENCICAFFLFETSIGRGRGIFRLTPLEPKEDSPEQLWRALTFYTSLQELKAHEESINTKRPFGVDHGDQTYRRTWLEEREKIREMDGMEPAVLVIGAGHSGLDIAARLGMLNVRTLVIDKNERVGDNWRKRYKT